MVVSRGSNSYDRVSPCLHDQVWPVCSHTRNPNAGLCCAIGSSHACVIVSFEVFVEDCRELRTSEYHLGQYEYCFSSIVHGEKDLRQRQSRSVKLLAHVRYPHRTATHHAKERRKARRQRVLHCIDIYGFEFDRRNDVDAGGGGAWVMR